MPFILPELPYAKDALGPYMSAETFEYHHDKHHKAYVDKANELIGDKNLGNEQIEKAMLAAYHDKNQALFNNLGQHYNHLHFWNWMKKDGGGTKIPAALNAKIKSDLGGYDKFKADFVNAGVTQFGSGWAWVVLDANGKLEITKTANGENPVIQGKTPILGVDVWEHSYYIDYRNARQKYLEAFVDHLINWDYVAQLFDKGPQQQS